MADPTVPDQGLGDLEAFLTLLRHSRGTIAEFEGNLDSRAGGLADEASRLASHSGALAQTLGSLATNLLAAQQQTAADLGTLVQVAGVTADERLATLRSGLEVARESLRVGFTKAHEQLEVGSAGVRESMTRSLEAADGLEAQLLDLESGADEVVVSCEAEIKTAAAALYESASQAHGTLDLVSEYLAEALTHYASTALQGLVAHLEVEVEPTLTGLLDDLGRNLLALFERLDAVVQRTAEDLTEAGEDALAETTRSLEGLLKNRERDEARTQDEVDDLLEENRRAENAVQKGDDTVSALGPLSSQLAAAREVADRVQEMMDVFNPFA